MNKALDSLHPDFKPLIVAFLAELTLRGINCVVTSGRRTRSEQNVLYAQGRTTKGDIVTKARGGESPHNFGLAADICPINPRDKSLWWKAPDEIWSVIHRLAEERDYIGNDGVPDLDSGYDWKFCDRPHVEDPRWKATQLAWKQGKIVIA